MSEERMHGGPEARSSRAETGSGWSRWTLWRDRVGMRELSPDRWWH